MSIFQNTRNIMSLILAKLSQIQTSLHQETDSQTKACIIIGVKSTSWSKILSTIIRNTSQLDLSNSMKIEQIAEDNKLSLMTASAIHTINVSFLKNVFLLLLSSILLGAMLTNPLLTVQLLALSPFPEKSDQKCPESRFLQCI